MLLEFLSHLLSFDLNWIIDLVVYNFLWVFILYAAVYLFSDGKKTLGFFLILVFQIWIMFDFTKVTGLVWATALFLGIFYITRMIIMVFAENTPSTKDHLKVIFVLHFATLLILFNIILK